MKHGEFKRGNWIVLGLQFLSLLVSISILGLLSGCGGSSGSGSSNSNQTPVTYTIGGTVSGLSGTGLVLQNNGGDNLTIASSGSFTFSTAVTSGGSYMVTVLTQPSNPAQTCAVTNGSGTASANVTSVQVACTTTPTYTIGGVVSGLSSTGLVLQDNGGDNLSISANGSFTFSTAIASGGAYDVTVLTQPSNPAQTCTVTNGSGTASANVTSVQVSCTTNVTLVYTIGGVVSGLSGTGLVLQNNDGDNLSVTANGDFTFSQEVADGGAYDVTVLTQPSNPTQTCAVTDGSGTASADVTSVEVSCTTVSTTNAWTWEGGSNIANQLGSYGTKGTAAPGNIPGGRYRATNWTDSSGNFWLFGGSGYDSVGTDSGTAALNDLWKYSPSTGEWTWMSGSSTGNQLGIYGTKGVAAASNVPGGRDAPTGWTDNSGNFWLFGGYGVDSAGNAGELNDLWKYSPSTGEWTWMTGSDLAGQSGTYGTKGTAATGNTPGGRQHAVSWTDASGNLWVFGGKGFDSVATADGDAYLNDLWKYSPSTGEWTWMGGSNIADQDGTYGTKGTGSTSNIPGARNVVAGWIDASGNLWLFGGNGYDSVGTDDGSAYLNDLWKYTPSSGEWTWVSGSDIGNQLGTYGTQGTAAAANIPGARWGSASWVDASGNLWLFGGLGVDDASADTGEYSDLWKYSPSSGEWTWVGGQDVANQVGTYGTKGTAASTNIPGGRERPVTWTDASGNLWLFGGLGYDSVGTAQGSGNLNDMWKYGPQ
jgi:Galactose oxidase, central domain